MSTVEIEGTARALKRLPITAAARVCKLRCGWLPVNEREARHDKDKRNGCSACSSVDLCPETVDHLFECSSPGRRSFLRKKCSSFKSLLELLRTGKLISRTLRVGMLCWINGRVPPDVSAFKLPLNPLGILISQAYIEQGQIGWNMAFQGFISRKWKEAQLFHLARAKGSWDSDGNTWVASVISWVFEMFADVWAQRNADEFGVDLEDQRRKKFVLCERAIRRLHTAGQDLPESEKFPFRKDISTILLRSLAKQEQWIASTERSLPGALQRVANRKASGQKALTDFFKRRSVDMLEDSVDQEVAASGVT